MAKKTSKTKRKNEPRQERRFLAQGGASTRLVHLLGALSALVLGAGAWAYVYAKSFEADERLHAVPAYLVAAGAVLLGITIWLGTSSEAPVRVGAPGVALEKGEVRRMPWWAIDKITFDDAAQAVLVRGRDEAGVDLEMKLSLKTHAEAIGWLVREAQERIPRRVDIPEGTLEKLPVAVEHAGQRIDLEPLQVVGKKDAITGKMITYEPDARVCPRCERVYAKRSVPKKCKCGQSLVHLRPKDGEEDADGIDEDTSLEETAETAES